MYKIKSNIRINLLLSFFTKQSDYYAIKDPLSNLISNFNDIRTILSASEDLNIIKLLYYNHKTIHQILYDEEEIINLIYNNNKKGLANNFYLNLLINQNQSIINYSYSIDYIKEVNKERRKTNDKYKNILYAKCIIDLIKNHKQNCEYNDDIDEQILENIEEENKEIIYKNFYVFNSLGLNYNYNYVDILKKSIDEIYLEIIVNLITKKINDYEFVINILEELELINIEITNEMFEKICKILKDEKYVKDYLILNIDDLYDEKKINFYFILIKYILKTSIFFMNIPFLFQLKKILLESIKKIINLNLKNNHNIEKIEFIIKTLLDSKYYWQKYLNNKYLILEEVLKYYKEYKFETKKENIKIIEEIIKNNENVDIQKYIQDYEIAKKLNLRKPIINYLYKEDNNNEKKTEKQINDDVNRWNEIEKMILDNKLKKLGKLNKIKLLNYFKDKNNKEYLLKIFKLKDYEFFIKYVEQENNEQKKQKSKNHIINEIIEKPTNNEQHDEKNEKEKITKYDYIDAKNQEKQKSTNYKSSINTDNKNIISNENKNEIVNLEAPAPFIKGSINNHNIIPEFLDKNTLFFHYNPKENKSIYDKVFFGKHDIEIDYGKLIEYKEACKEIKDKSELAKNYILYMNFLNQIETELKEKYNHKYNLKLKLESNLELINNNTDSSIYNMTSKYTFFEPIDNYPKLYIEDNILINGTNSNSQGFQFMLNDINSPIYENLEYTELNSKTEINTVNKINIVNKNNKINNDKENKDLNKNSFRVIDDPLFKKKASDEKILEYVNVIGKHNNAAEYFIELSNGFYISGGCDNSLILYDNQFIEKMKIKELKDWPFKLIEKKDSRKNNQNKITLLCCTNRILLIIFLDTLNLKYNIKEYELEDKTVINCFEMKENNIITVGYGGASYFIDMFNNNSQLIEYYITDKTYRGGIKINDKTIALTSNDIMPNGENKLIYYNIKSKNVSYVTEDYSFTMSNNNLALLSQEKLKNNKILLCACKRYRKGQKNGILLINPNPGDNRKINNEFYDTDNYEVYCFCQICIVKNNNDNYNNINKEYRKHIEVNETDYFFVGGFDLDKRIGIIKMFKVIFNEKIYDSKIEFIQDIIFDEEKNFEDFNGPFTSIYQSKISGHIIATSYNGNIYAFTPPNMDFYLDNDE